MRSPRANIDKATEGSVKKVTYPRPTRRGGRIYRDYDNDGTIGAR